MIIIEDFIENNRIQYLRVISWTNEIDVIFLINIKLYAYKSLENGKIWYNSYVSKFLIIIE